MVVIGGITIEPVSLGIGAGIIIILWIILWIFRKLTLKKYTIDDLKKTIKDAHDNMSNAVDDITKSHDNLKKLYKAMIDLEKDNS